MNRLPLLHQQHYEAFEQRLKQFSQIVRSFDGSGTVVQSGVMELQQLFRDRLLNLPMDAVSPEMQHWVQSYQVEIDKQLRLLGMDVMFLQAARQAGTIEQRQQQVLDRLGTLQRYCDALLGEMSEGRGFDVSAQPNGERGEG